MTDFKETKESQEAVKPQEKTDSSTSSVLQSSVRGDVGGQADTPQHQPKDDDNLATTHPAGEFEKAPFTEGHPQTIQPDNEGQAEDPKKNEDREGKMGSLQGPYRMSPEG